MNQATKKVGMLLNSDRCTGCFSCQAACREVNLYSYDEQWMQVVRRDPYYVDGSLRQYHLVAPSLDKCALCYEKDSSPLCTRVCTGAALFVAPVESLLEIMANNGRKGVLFTP